MARREIKIKQCDRCIKPTRAAGTETFGLNGVSWEIDLCDPHADALHRDLAGWHRLAREVSKEYFERSAEIKPGSRAQENAEAMARFEAKYGKPAPTTREVYHAPAPTLHDPLEAFTPEVRNADLTSVPPLARNWVMTSHAKERADERGYTIEQCLMAAAFPDIIGGGAVFRDGLEHRGRGPVAVIANPSEEVIVTVLHRGSNDHDPLYEKG